MAVDGLASRRVEPSGRAGGKGQGQYNEEEGDDGGEGQEGSSGEQGQLITDRLVFFLED
jgi:hypothetical protein